MNRSLTSSQIYDGEYFEIVSSEGDILVVRCNICNPEGTDASQLLRTSTKSNGNILKHIKRRHGELLDKIKVTKSVKSRAPRIRVEGDCNSSTPMQVKKQPQDSDEDYDEKLMGASEDNTIYNTSDGMYVIEPIQCDPTDSEQEEYVEIDGEDILEDYEPLDSTEFELVHKAKRKRLNPLNVVDLNNATTRPAQPSTTSPDKSFIELQKQLLQAEHDEMIKQRAEKHQLEISILKAELAHKTMEHQKRMELLSKQLSDSSK